MHQEMIKNSILKEKLAFNDKIINKPPTPEAIILPKASQSQMHWSAYRQDPTPDYIIEAKKRLGQIKQPNVVPSSSVNDTSNAPKNNTTPEKPPKNLIQKHWSQMDNPSTPDYIKQIRKRLGDDRYKRTELTKSKSFTAPTSSGSNHKSTDAEAYKIPTFMSVNTNVNIITSDNPAQQQNVDTLILDSNYTNFLPVNEEATIKNEIDRALEIAKKYDETQPTQERLLNSRASNNSRNEFHQTDQKNPVSFDAWLKSNPDEQEKESVLRALKHTGSVACASPSIQFKQPVYLHSSYVHESPKNQYNEFIRMTVKNPSPPASSVKRRAGTPTMRALGQTRGTNIHTNLSIENEKNFIRDYLWNVNR